MILFLKLVYLYGYYTTKFSQMIFLYQLFKSNLEYELNLRICRLVEKIASFFWSPYELWLLNKTIKWRRENLIIWLDAQIKLLNNPIYNEIKNDDTHIALIQSFKDCKQSIKQDMENDSRIKKCS